MPRRRTLLRSLIGILALSVGALHAQHQPPPIPAGSEHAYVEARLTELDAATTDEQRAALIRLAFTAVDPIASRGEFTAAEELFERVLAAAESTLGGGHVAIGELLTHATRVPMWREEWGLAADGLKVAVQLLDPDSLYLCIALNALAICEDRMSMTEPALEHVDEAIRIGALDPESRAQAYGLALNTKAVILSRAHRLDAAALVRERLSEHLAVHAEGLEDLAYAQYEGHAVLAHKAGLDQESRASLARAVELAQELYGTRSLEVARLQYLHGTLLMHQGEPDRAIEVLTDATAMLEDARLLPEGSEIILHSMSPWRALAYAHLVAGRGVEALEAVEGHTGRLTLHGWGLAGDASTNARIRALRSIPEIQATLRDDEALVGWLLQDQLQTFSRGCWFGFVLRSEGPPHWVEIEADGAGRQALADGLRRHVTLEGLSALAVPDRDAAQASARAAHDTMIAPLVPHLEGVDELVVLAPQGLDFVPFACLSDANGVALAERYTLTFVPSGSFHAELRERANAEGRGRRAILVGDPPFRPAHVEAMRADDLVAVAEPPGARRGTTKLEPTELPRLSGTREEVLALTTRFPGSTPLLGTEAELDAVREKALEADVLHLATHARFEPERAYRSALYFACAADGTPSPLTIADLLKDWRTKAELVTLSACSTGLGQELISGTELGFPQAFLAIGARSVLATRWAVDDRATSLFMRAYYDAWLGADGEPGLSKAAALQRAIRVLRSHVDGDGKRPYEHPYYWAGFVLYGDGR